MLTNRQAYQEVTPVASEAWHVVSEALGAVPGARKDYPPLGII